MVAGNIKAVLHSTLLDFIMLKQPHLNLKYPRFWTDTHSLPGARPSDKDFIFGLMRWIPDDEKHRVSCAYEKIHQKGEANFRGKANTFLMNEAMKHGYKPKPRKENDNV